MALVSAICALTGLIGVGLAHSVAASDPAVVLLSAEDTDHPYLDDETSTTGHRAVDVTARQRALLTRLRPLPLAAVILSLAALCALCSRRAVAHSPAPPTSLTGRDVLSRLCIARC